MALLGSKEARERGVIIANSLTELENAAIEAKASEDVDGLMVVNDLVESGVNPEVAEALREPLAIAIDDASGANTVGDQGEGYGKIHPDTIKAIETAGFRVIEGTGDRFTVEIAANAEGTEKLEVELIKSNHHPDPDDAAQE